MERSKSARRHTPRPAQTGAEARRHGGEHQGANHPCFYPGQNSQVLRQIQLPRTMRTRRQFHNFTISPNTTIPRNCEIVVWDNFTTSPHPLYPVGVRGEVAKLSLHRREAVRGLRNCQPTGRARTPHKTLQHTARKEPHETRGRATGERRRLTSHCGRACAEYNHTRGEIRRRLKETGEKNGNGKNDKDADPKT